MKKAGILFIFLLVLVLTGSAQKDSAWNVCLVRKGFDKKVEPGYAKFSNHGFYLVRNCVYDVSLKTFKSAGGRLIDIKKDTLYFTNFFNANAAFMADSKLDTVAVYYRDLDKLSLVADRAMGIYTRHSFDNFEFIFTKDTVGHYFKSDWVKLYDNDEGLYEVVAHLTEQGVDALFEQNGRTYFYYGPGMIKPDPADIDDTYDVNNVFSFTPCKVEEINGLALGLHAKNNKNDEFLMRDTLIIRGINIEINPFSLIGLTHAQYTGPCADSISIYEEQIRKDWRVKVSGINISLVTTINEMRLKGINITGVNTVIDEISGFSVCGFNTFAYKMEGLSIAGIRNRATEAKGVQIALFNKANELRGFQFGLWNVNGKRSLPIINWQFRK